MKVSELSEVEQKQWNIGMFCFARVVKDAEGRAEVDREAMAKQGKFYDVRLGQETAALLAADEAAGLRLIMNHLRGME